MYVKNKGYDFTYWLSDQKWKSSKGQVNKALEPTYLSSIFVLFRLPSLKVSTLLLSGLLLYDVFWVFFSQYVFNANVMVKVATRPADNPVGAMARKLHIGKDTWGKKKFNSTISQRFVTISPVQLIQLEFFKWQRSSSRILHIILVKKTRWLQLSII